MDSGEFKKRLENEPFAALGELVYNYLFEIIIKASILPGEKISTTKIAEELGISRTPVRAALDRLANEGFVERTDRKGFRVPPLNINDVIELYDFRKIIEGNAAYIAANTMTLEEMRDLEQLVLNPKKLVQPFEPVTWINLDTGFHKKIVLSTHNKYLIDAFRNIETRMNRYKFIMTAYNHYNQKADIVQGAEKHICIFKALKNRFSQVAKNEMIEHLDHVFFSVLRLKMDNK
ncbi:MAG: GntR family transcriptional regulator [Peptococcaceae bacterium]|nr:GntR family transcriptional regulator [Peptococcaceae bacterium]MDH7526137.1 GntR family transcriptional regulator [Peptococcaceae bacterium]